MRNKACSQAAPPLGTVITCIAIAVKSKRRCIIRYRIVLDVMSLTVQLRCIICNLCIESTQVLASRIVCRHIIQFLASFCNRRIIVVQRLARYQLVGSRSIRSFFRCAFRECICTKSRAPGVFAVLLSRCRGVFILDRLFIFTKLHVALFICLVDLDVVAEI